MERDHDEIIKKKAAYALYFPVLKSKRIRNK